MTRSTERREHWDHVYGSKSPQQVSWYQDTPESSLELIAHTGAGPEAAVIDVGGGASLLVDHLLDAGYRDLTVLDVSERALELARSRLGQRANDVAWIHADVTAVELDHHYDVWHDRAVFHFLTDEDDRRRYGELLHATVPPAGHVIVATFAPDGPERCSGLPVVRYSPDSLTGALGPDLSLVETWDERHRTPAGRTQHFIFCRFRRDES